MTLKTVLVTGGAGFIGAECVVELVEHGHKVVVIDNCSNAVVNEISKLPVTLERIAEITGVDVPFYNIDLRDTEKVVEIFLEVRLCRKITTWFSTGTANPRDSLCSLLLGSNIGHRSSVVLR